MIQSIVNALKALNKIIKRENVQVCVCAQTNTCPCNRPIT